MTFLYCHLPLPIHLLTPADLIMTYTEQQGGIIYPYIKQKNIFDYAVGAKCCQVIENYFEKANLPTNKRILY